MKNRRLIALLLCICLLGSMTVYAVDSETEPNPDAATEVSALYTQMMAAESAEAMYGLLLADQQTAAAFTADEIKSLTEKAQTLADDGSKEELLETLDVILASYVGTEPPIVETLETNLDTFTDGMTQVTANLENRAFYLILNRNYYGITDTIVTTDYTGGNLNQQVMQISAQLESEANSAKVLDDVAATKWLFEAAGTAGEYYIKSLGPNNTGKYMNFSAGSAVLDTNPVPTKVYGYTSEVTVDDATKYLALYGFVQVGSDGTLYALNQYGGTSYNGFCGHGAATLKGDTGQLFRMKEAQYEAEFGASVIQNDLIIDGATIKVFNYDANINDSNKAGRFQFVHGTGYINKMAHAPTDPTKGGTVDGAVGSSTDRIAFPDMKLTLNADGHPEANDSGAGIAYLFEEDNGYLKGKMTDGGGLFKYENGYYVYDSIKNAAYYNPDSKRFDLYNVAISPSYTQSYYKDINQMETEAKESVESIGVISTDVQSGNFLPFNQITSDTAFNEGSKQSSGVPRYSLKHTTDVDMWFGLTTDFEFYMPENGQKNGEDMVFRFTGDDDVWAYVDGVLVLDIGGTHGALDGTINFATGDVTYSNSKDTNVQTTLKECYQKALEEVGENTATGKKIKNILDNGFEEWAPGRYRFKDFTKHSFDFFYLERGGNISYCQLKYNMDPLPKSNVSVRKEVAGVNPALSDNKEYTFNVFAEHNTPSEIETILYEITDLTTTEIVGSGSLSRASGDNYGSITLKDNQSVSFALPQGTTIRFEEVVDPAVTSSMKWKLNGQDIQNSDVQFYVGTNNASAEFVCENTRITKELSVEKIVDGDRFAAADNDEFEFVVNIDGKAYNGTATKSNGEVVTCTNGHITIKKDETFTITGIPTDMNYEVVEQKPVDRDAYVYDGPAYKVAGIDKDAASGKFDNANIEVQVTNTLRLLYGNLKITKDGIQSVDHHDEAGKQKEEKQSTIFNISGTSNSGVKIDMDVVIHGNDSVIVNHIPVGTYTVTEKKGWSWRYSPDKESQNVTVLSAQTPEVIFENTRDESKWLSGDNFFKNLFNGQN